MPIKQADGVYELPKGKDEQIAAASKYGVRMDSFATDNEFHSTTVTIGGKNAKEYEPNGETDIFDYDEDEDRDKYWEERGSSRIEGLKCPDCGAQAFKTDQKNVAVCGDYPGWYFFFRRTDLDKSAKSKIQIKIINGVPTYVDESGTEVNKNE